MNVLIRAVRLRMSLESEEYELFGRLFNHRPETCDVDKLDKCPIEANYDQQQLNVWMRRHYRKL